jgi:hypothetical protein
MTARVRARTVGLWFVFAVILLGLEATNPATEGHIRDLWDPEGHVKQEAIAAHEADEREREHVRGKIEEQQAIAIAAHEADERKHARELEANPPLPKPKPLPESLVARNSAYGQCSVVPTDGQPKVLVLVLSGCNNTQRRGWVREMMQQANTSAAISYKFLLGSCTAETREEGRKHGGDMLHVDITDTYEVSSKKMLLGLDASLHADFRWHWLMKVDDDVSIRFPQLMDGISRIPVVRCSNGDGVSEVPMWWSSFNVRKQPFFRDEQGTIRPNKTNSWWVDRMLVTPYLQNVSAAWLDVGQADAAFSATGSQEHWDHTMALAPEERQGFLESIGVPRHAAKFVPQGPELPRKLLYPDFGHGVGHVMNRAMVQGIVREQNSESWITQSGVWMEDAALGIWFSALKSGGCRIHDHFFITHPYDSGCVTGREYGGIATEDGLVPGSLHDYRSPCSRLAKPAWHPPTAMFNAQQMVCLRRGSENRPVLLPSA